MKMNPAVRTRGTMGAGCLVLVLILAVSPARIWAAPAPAAFRPDRVLVRPNPDADLTPVHAVLGTRVRRVFPGLGALQVLELPPGLAVANAVAAYQASGLARYSEPDYLLQLLVEPNDFNYLNGDLWHLKNLGQYGGLPGADIEAVKGWDLRSTCSNLIVAVIDTGIRATHQDLAPNLWRNPGESGTDALGLDRCCNLLDDDNNGYIDDVHGINAILGTGDPRDDHGHGSHVSGAIGAAGNNGLGVTGVAWQARLMACKFLNPDGQGSISDAIECLEYARLHGARVINASWGGYTFTSAALLEAMTAVRDAGVLVAAACGNDHSNNDVTPLYPAGYDLDNIVAVAATGRMDDLAWFSNYGATTVDLGAPGSPVFSCWNGSDGDYRYLEGTSMAAPLVAGVAALVRAQWPDDTPAQVIARLLAATDAVPGLAGTSVTGGRLNLLRALGGAELAAGFTATPLTGLAPLTVSFTDTSTGPVTSWLWDFGDGTAPSTEPNPAHVYNLIGTYEPSLTVGNDSGLTSTNRQTIVVTGWLSVTPDSSFVSAGVQGGPFSPANMTYTLRNRGGAALTWSAGDDVDWLTLSSTGGTLGLGRQVSVKVTINSAANALPPGTNAGTLFFNNLSNGDGSTARPVQLVITPSTVGVLALIPSTGFTSQGPRGGPFDPAAVTYELRNTGGGPLGWTATSNRSWLSCSPASGSLDPGASAPVTFSITAAANTLKPGSVLATVTLKSTPGNVTTRLTITLKVQ
jgi:subtilisin family serine protease